MSAHCYESVGGYLFAWGYSVFSRPLLALLAGMLDDRVRAREHQARMTIVETHQVWRLAARSADLDDLARPLWLAHDVATHVQPVSDGCLHPPASLTCVRAAPVGRRTSHGVRIATTSIHLDAHGSSRLCVGGRVSGMTARLGAALRAPVIHQDPHAARRDSCSGPVQMMNSAIATYWHVAAAQTQAWKTSW